jgi:hypothetical protein
MAFTRMVVLRAHVKSHSTKFTSVCYGGSIWCRVVHEPAGGGGVQAGPEATVQEQSSCSLAHWLSQNMHGQAAQGFQHHVIRHPSRVREQSQVCCGGVLPKIGEDLHEKAVQGSQVQAGAGDGGTGPFGAVMGGMGTVGTTGFVMVTAIGTQIFGPSTANTSTPLPYNAS